MRRAIRGCSGIGLAALAVGLAVATAAETGGRAHPLETPDGLTLYRAVARAETHDGRACLRLTGEPGHEGHVLAILEDSSFRDGTIEVELTGEPVPGTESYARGFVGVAFRAADDGYELLYLRPTNARSDDQLRRNHSTQYASYPGWNFDRFRRESPGVYESYVDLVPGAWTDVRIEVSGVKARLFVNGADQPCLIVNELKRGDSEGAVGLWLHSSTIARFRNLRITPDGG